MDQHFILGEPRPQDTATTIGNRIRHWAAGAPETPALLKGDGEAVTYARLAWFMYHLRDELSARGFGRCSALPSSMTPVCAFLC